MPDRQAADSKPGGAACVLVIGATGTTGRRLVRQLVAAGHEVIAASRSGAAVGGACGVRFDWHAPASHPHALAGVDRVYLIPPIGNPRPELVMLPFLELASEASVRRVVLHSSSPTPAGGPGTGIVHQAIPDLFDDWAVLRPTWFMQDVTGQHPYALMIRHDRALVTATGSSRVAFIDAGDVAKVAATALSGHAALNRDLILTGPQPLSFNDIATILSRASDTTIRHLQVPRDQLAAHYERAGVDRRAAAFVTVMDSVIASGSEDRVTDAVQQVTGTAPRSFTAFADAEFRL